MVLALGEVYHDVLCLGSILWLRSRCIPVTVPVSHWSVQSRYYKDWNKVRDGVHCHRVQCACRWAYIWCSAPGCRWELHCTNQLGCVKHDGGNSLVRECKMYQAWLAGVDQMLSFARPFYLALQSLIYVV